MKQPRPRMATVVATLVMAIFLTISFSGSALFATPVEQSAGTVNRTSNVRSGPSIDFDVLDVFTEGQAIEVVGQNADGSWYALSGGQWIAAFLVDGADASGLPVMTADDTTMSDDADESDSSSSDSSPSDSSSSDSEPSQPVAPVDTGTSYVATVKSNGNLRAGPSTLYDVVGGIAEGTTINLVGQTPFGNWFILDTGEWISISLIANPPGPLTYVTPVPSASEDSSDSPPAATATSVAEEGSEPEPTEAPQEEATPEPTEEPAEEPTPEPTEEPEEEPTPEPTAPPTPDAEPEVTIPNGWTEITDSERGYSLAIPPGWSELDLRGSQFAQLATTFGQGEAVSDLQDFLATEEGQSVGVVAITDIANTFFGGLPTLLNVSIIEAPGATPDLLVDYIGEVLELNEAMLGDVNITEISAATINNLPAVTGDGTGDLASVGVNAEAYVKVVGLIYNDNIYMITLGTQSTNMAQYDSIFDDIIGTLKPE